MAKTTTAKVTAYHEKTKHKRPGIHAKSKVSRLKGSKNYVKAYVGQGR